MGGGGGRAERPNGPGISRFPEFEIFGARAARFSRVFVRNIVCLYTRYLPITTSTTALAAPGASCVLRRRSSYDCCDDSTVAMSQTIHDAKKNANLASPASLA